MGTVIVLVVLAVVLVFAVRSSAKHFKGEGGCCGGGGEVRAEKKKLSGPKVAEVVLTIEGMHCDNCKNRVENLLNGLDGVSARVNLHRGQATVSMDRPVEDAALKAAVERGGYTVTEMQRKEF